MSERASAWERFWFARAPSDTLALVRVFLGLSCVLRFTGLYGFANRATRASLDLGLPVHRFGEGSWRFERVPVPVVDGAPTMALDTYRDLETAALVLGLLFCVGLGARVVGPLLAVVLLATQLFDQAAFKHHIFTLAVAVLVVGLGPCNDRFSLDSWLALKSGSTLRSVLPLRMLQTMVSAIYLFSLVAKLNASWFTGFLMRYSVERAPVEPTHLLHGFHTSALAPIAWVALSWTTLLMEAFLVVGFWSARLRPWAIATGLALHVGIELSLDVGSYSTTMLALYAAFLAPATRTLLVRCDLSSARGRWWARAVRALDWGARFEVVAGRPVHGAVDVVDRRGGVRAHGRRALALILRRLPLTQPVGLLLSTSRASATRGA